MQLTGERWHRTPWWRLFGAIFAITFGLMAIWSVSVPLLSGPDEPTHVVKASGVIRGEFVGQCGANVTNSMGSCSKNSAFTEVRVPAFYSSLRPSGKLTIPHHGVTCFAKHVKISASCLTIRLPEQFVGTSKNAWIY